MNGFFIYIFFHHIFQVSSLGDPCRHGWFSYNGKCYMLSVEQETWTDSEMRCRIFGGHLAEIVDMETNKYLKDLTKTRNKDDDHHYFIGLTDEAQTGTWEWVQSRTLPNFTDWGSNQPDHKHNDEHCVMLFAGDDYRWHDVDCDYKQYFICEEEEQYNGGGSAIIG